MVAEDGGHGGHAGDHEADVHLDNRHDVENDDVPSNVRGTIVDDAEA